MNWKKSALALSLSLAGAFAALSDASAATPWMDQHPARTEVLGRAGNLSHRINQERREGDLTPVQAHRLHVATRGVVRREQRDARLNGGHLTAGKTRRLNRQENAISRHIPE